MYTATANSLSLSAVDTRESCRDDCFLLSLDIMPSSSNVQKQAKQSIYWKSIEK